MTNLNSNYEKLVFDICASLLVVCHYRRQWTRHD